MAVGKTLTAEQLMKNTKYLLPSLSRDNMKLLFASDEGGVPNTCEMDMREGSVRKLTDSGEPVYPMGYAGNGSRFLFAKDEGGNELFHIYLQDGDRCTDLTDARGAVAHFFTWNEDRSGFFFTWNRRDNRFFDLWHMDLDNMDKVMVYENGRYNIGAVDLSGSLVALELENTGNDSDIYLYDGKTGTEKLLTPHSGEVKFSAAGFSRDGSRLFMLTDEGREFRYLAVLDLNTLEREELMVFQGDVRGVSFSDDCKKMAVLAGIKGSTGLFIRDMDTGSDREVKGLPKGQTMSPRFSPDNTFLTFVAGTSARPEDIHVLSLGSDELRRVTRALNPEVDPEDLTEGTYREFESFDGLRVPGILYRPQDASVSEPVPAVVFVHGGPGGESVLFYTPMIQLMVNHGFAVFCVNNRGSSGYGKTFFRAADHRHGEVDLDDCVWAGKYLRSLPFVDPGRVGIMGGSYGGYMTLAALAFRPDAFKVGVDLFGISNWLRTLREMPVWWGAHREVLLRKIGDPDTEEEYLRSISPLFHYGNIRKPLLVIQGANDPRVLQAESDEIVEKVREAGVPVEYVLFDDEGHGFRKKSNQITADDAIVGFLEEYL
ncbi:MAG: hypothetical protein AVO35_12020 [Candidatus Aegiribacteria sp. MLS_C]|nr:MAG: hypothetical protein AVO35_12020 [Candidatus Aegiribacteria sp. MLS_C]